MDESLEKTKKRKVSTNHGPPLTWCFFVFPQQQNFAMGSLAQIGSGPIWCSFNTRFRTRFRRVLVQIPPEVPDGSGADTSWGSGGFRWRYLLRLRRVLCGSGGFRDRYLVRFRRVPVQIRGEVPEGFGADTLWGSGSLRCRYSVRFRRVPVQIPCEVPEGSGADTLWGSGSFRCRYSVRFRRVTVQILG